MIRGQSTWPWPFANPKAEIVRHSEKLATLYTGRARRIAFVRSRGPLGDDGSRMRALSFSSRIAMEEETTAGEPVEFPANVFWGSMVVAMLFMLASSSLGLS